MSMYNMLEYSQNYSMTLGSLWNYFKDEIDDVDKNASDGKSFKCKTKIVGKHHKHQNHRHDHHKIQMELNHHDHHNHQYQL